MQWQDFWLTSGYILVSANSPKCRDEFIEEYDRCVLCDYSLVDTLDELPEQEKLRHSKFGIVSILLSAGFFYSLVSDLLKLFSSEFIPTKPHPTTYKAVEALLIVACNLVGLVSAIVGIRQEHRNATMAYIGLILNVLPIMFYLTILFRILTNI